MQVLKIVLLLISVNEVVVYILHSSNDDCHIFIDSSSVFSRETKDHVLI
jgi:hypothetical protein